MSFEERVFIPKLATPTFINISSFVELGIQTLTSLHCHFSLFFFSQWFIDLTIKTSLPNPKGLVKAELWFLFLRKVAVKWQECVINLFSPKSLSQLCYYSEFLPTHIYASCSKTLSKFCTHIRYSGEYYDGKIGTDSPIEVCQIKIALFTPLVWN